MNTQNILQKGRTRLDIILDNSELHDYNLVEDIEYEFGWVDVKLDSSEFYDYFLGDNVIDYIYREVEIIVGTYLVTEDDYLFKTHDNYYIKYH